MPFTVKGSATTLPIYYFQLLSLCHKWPTMLLQLLCGGFYPQFLAIMLQFYGTGKAAAAIIAAPAATADSLARS